MATNRGPPSEAEVKARIITHMNSQHTRELSHYLRHYVGVSPRAAAASPKIHDLDFNSMTIKTSNNTYVVPFHPALSSWADARPRIIAMDETAREALGLSNIYITEYVMQRGFDYIPFVGVVFYFVCAAGLPWVVPGSAPWEVLKVVFPGGPEWFRWVVNAIFWPVMGIHLVESWLLDRWRLQKHGVARWSLLWWKWETANFFEGLTVWKRLDGLVAEKKAEKEAKKN
jgi:hypothetical protein